MPASGMALQVIAPAAHCAYTRRVVMLAGTNAPFAVEVFAPRARGKVPLVLMLPGSAGAYSVDASSPFPERDNFGEHALAAACFAVVLPHYLESAGKESMTDRDEVVRLSPLLLDAVERTLDYATRLPAVRRGRVGVFGESLGGYLAVQLAANRPEVVAVSAIGAGALPGLLVRNRSWRALLVFRGEHDAIVPPDEAERLVLTARQSGVATRTITFRRLGHYLNARARLQTVSQTLLFFRGVLARYGEGMDTARDGAVVTGQARRV